jgi:hypothetical protein
MMRLCALGIHFPIIELALSHLCKCDGHFARYIRMYVVTVHYSRLILTIPRLVEFGMPTPTNVWLQETAG